ncbi:MAG: molybdopterin-guanine dinucleotide biosynthesis protein B [Euryarchaeota archaeon]|jgi:molybdopterin-guanine dinucleotide biosynthesis adapter protein|nr:molybdopterin-guanine dinucleotide biosynthesis protein B [Euryarchaeota archaeon]
MNNTNNIDSSVEPIRRSSPVILGFYGRSNSGKTTLLEVIIPMLKNMGLRVATIKQTHHKVSADTKGKDTWRHRQAGADPVILSSYVETALFMGHKLSLEEMIRMLTYVTPVDIILLEGWKHEDVPKVFIGGEGEEMPGTLLHYNDEPSEVLNLIREMMQNKQLSKLSPSNN